MADYTFTADYSDLKSMTKELSNFQGSAVASASVFEKAFLKVERQISALVKKNQSLGQSTVQVVKGNQAYYNSLTGVTKAKGDLTAKTSLLYQALQKEEAEVKQVTKETKVLDAQYENLKLSIDPLYAATQAYERKLAVLNAQFKDKSSKEYGQQLALLRKQAGRAGLKLDDMNKVVGLSNKGTRQMELGFQQAGYQIQDFIIQVQGGVNPLIAFSQQGSQLAGFFAGPWGAMIGLGIAALSTLGLAFMSTREEAKTFEDQLGDLSGAVDEYTKFSDLATLSTIELYESFGKGAIAGQQVAAYLSEWAKADAISQLSDSVEEISNTFGGLGDNIIRNGRRGQEALTQLGQTAKGIAKEFDITQEQAEAIARSLQEFGQADGIDNQARAAVGLNDTLLRIYDNLGDIPEELVEITKQSGLVALEGLEIEGAISGANGEIDKMAPKFRAALGEALNLKSVFDKLMSFTVSTNIKQGYAQYGQSRVAAEGAASTTTVSEQLANYQKYGQYTAPSKKGSNSSASQKVEDKARKYIESLREELKFKKSLVGQSEEQVSKLEWEYELKKNGIAIDDKRIARLYSLQQATQLATETEEKRASRVEHQTDAVETMFESFYSGVDSLGGAFNTMIYDVISEIYQAEIIKPLASNVVGAVTSVLGFANGGAFSQGVQMYAKGDVFNAPTAFSHSGGLGVMGEAGPEAIMPLKRGADGKLGVATDSSSGGSQQVVVNYNINGNGDDYIKQQIAASAGGIVQAAEASILSKRKRGGQFKSVFK